MSDHYAVNKYRGTDAAWDIEDLVKGSSISKAFLSPRAAQGLLELTFRVCRFVELSLLLSLSLSLSFCQKRIGSPKKPKFCEIELRHFHNSTISRILN